jgi:hypothetical protein
MIENLTIEEIKWLLNDYNRIRDYGKVTSWIDWHVRALTLLKGSWEKPSCNCQYSVTGRIGSSTYAQFEQALKDRLVILETPVIDELPAVTKRSRGRSKKDTQE